jgi:hypothetical protein
VLIEIARAIAAFSPACDGGLRALPVRNTSVGEHGTGCGDDFLFERVLGRGGFIDLDA